jgi:hypothetical protein
LLRQQPGSRLAIFVSNGPMIPQKQPGVYLTNDTFRL